MRQPFAWILVAVLVNSTGCRTYGGHGSEAATFVAIERAVAWGTQERSRLSNDEMAFDQATDRLPFLEDFAPRLDDLSASLTRSMGEWSTRAATVDETSGYRDLNRVLGSIVAERQLYEDRYRRLVLDMGVALGGMPSQGSGASRYQVAPAHYERLEAGLESVRIRELVTASE